MDGRVIATRRPIRLASFNLRRGCQTPCLIAWLYNSIRPQRHDFTAHPQELANFGLRSRSDGARRDSVPVQLKLAWSPEWGVLLGAEAHVAIRGGADPASGFGDTTVVLKRAWAVDDATGFGLELGVKLATAKDSIGSGNTDTSLNAIYSKDLGSVHIDANLNFTRLGAVDVSTGRIQTGLSASFLTSLNAQWGVTAELSGTRRSGADSSRQVLGALSYSPSKRLTFDIGVARAAKPSLGATSVFAGVVFPVAVLC